MIKNSLIGILFFLIFFLIIYSDEIVNYSSDNVIILKKNDIIILNNNVKLESPSFSLTADSVLINRNNKIIYAFGDIVLTRNETQIDGDSVFYNYDEKDGLIFGGKSKVDKGYFFGNEIYSLTEDEYYIYNGYFTTCDYIENPHYKLWGNKMHYYNNDKIIMRPAVLFLRNVPVFALPFAVLPAVTTRKSGFLIPNIGYDKLDGLYIKDLSYFLATNDFSDMTFTMDYMYSKGYVFYYEARAIINPYLRFNLQSSYIYEFSGKRRWALNGDYSHNLPLNINLKSRIDYVSDMNIEADYSDTTVVNLKRTAKTFISLSKSFNKYSSYISFSRNQDFADNSITMTLPSYNGYFSKIRLFSVKYLLNNSLYFSHSHSFVNNQIDTDTSHLIYKIYSFRNTFDTYYRFLYFINIKPYYDISYFRNENDSLSYIKNGYHVSMNTQIYGTSMFGIKLYDKIRHTFIPSISYNNTKNNYLRYNDFAIIDSIIENENITFSIANLWEGKRKNRIEIIARNDNSISYNLKNDSLSLLSSNISFYPSSPLNCKVGISYNIYEKEYTGNFNMNFRKNIFNPFSDKKNLNIFISQNVSFNNDSIVSNQINSGFNSVIGEQLNINVNILYDIDNRQFVSTSISLNRDLHCWDAVFKVSTYGDVFKYDFSISLKAFPELSIDKDILGPLFL